jgi:hypothetical protein
VVALSCPLFYITHRLQNIYRIFIEHGDVDIDFSGESEYNDNIEKGLECYVSLTIIFL